MKSLSQAILAAGVLLCLAPMTAQAKTTPEVPPAQSQAFLLGYTLRTSDLRAGAYSKSVTMLAEFKDDKSPQTDKIAGAQIVHLSAQAEKLRRAQATAFWQVAKLMTSLGAPKTLHDWATRTADLLDADLIYSDEAKALAKTEPDTARVLAELDEIKGVKDAANARHPALAAWLKLNGGVIAVWTADVGSYAADLHTAGPPLIGVTRRLLQRAPGESPSAVRGDLSELIPQGGGNLQDLATIPPAVSSAKMSRVYQKLLDCYNVRKQAEALDGG